MDALEKTMEWLEIYETTKKNYFIKECQCQLLINLVEMGIDIFTIREKYKEVLEKTKRYNHNYYAHICVMIDLMVIKKVTKSADLTNLKLEDFGYNELAVKENMQSELSNRTVGPAFRVSKNTYAWIDYEEGVGEKVSAEFKEELLNLAKELLNMQTIDINLAQKCRKELKDYIILTFGRWSEEYKKVLELEADLVGYPLTPRLAMMAFRYNLKRDIKRLLEICN